eukprot:CAMPEP_0179946018 /NCGR_PEP_ID=MMETSP0983-20121128/20082_1 /TAXON_ID=483367 /ORGANISM="non described non described, Strain CCMP 2436" /LENGTH=116 /DNA_ID=CAMNT_0021854671 /DNA_START=208 /DNA_END=556 /DNA_ORIENTATION=-
MSWRRAHRSALARLGKARRAHLRAQSGRKIVVVHRVARAFGVNRAHGPGGRASQPEVGAHLGDEFLERCRSAVQRGPPRVDRIDVHHPVAAPLRRNARDPVPAYLAPREQPRAVRR